ncbi:elongation factor-like GTPase 1 isoform X2 [Brevipalpus obovatus]|uniref:elongation factor-like GTPase 1 isoform X2 n=1 Tax=Brevipalpus obovatus TaxID=246614 RepID=UPI003D9ED0BA
MGPKDVDVGRIRNVCILAHVDHGKTTLADHLIASDGIITTKLAGKTRYMDSRPDEQQRGITMKSSSIALKYSMNQNDYLINLIDSPGHVDFCGEVSTAIRLCDGAIIVIDVIEGVCAQTRTAIRQAWIERLKPILVLNKIDRLILERKLKPLDAYVHLQQILEQVNAIMSEFFTADRIGKEEEEDTRTKENRGDNSSHTNDHDNEEIDDDYDAEDDSDIYFAPEQGNLIFASALDGWGFTIQNFSKWISKNPSKKLGFKEKVLNRTLWGDYYLNSKTKRIMKGAQAKAKEPLFVSLILKIIWDIYQSVIVEKDQDKIGNIVRILGIRESLTQRDLGHSDPRMVLQSIFTKWLSLAPNLLEVVCNLVPSPLGLDEARAEMLMCSNTTRFDLFPPETKKVKEAFVKCSPDGPIIVCVSKMFAVEKAHLPQNRYKPLTEEEIAKRRELVKTSAMKANSMTHTIMEDLPTKSYHSGGDNEANELEENVVFLAFARVFSGTLRKGMKLFVLHPKHDPSKLTDETVIDPNLKLSDLKSDQHITCVHIKDLYLLMGRGCEQVDTVKAGNVVGIGGLEEHIVKSATLSDNIYCPPFIDLQIASQPILRVAVEPQNPMDVPKLIKGLKLLNQSDPCVEVKIQDSGEHVIITTGEIHLQKCIDDLVNTFAGIEVNVSSPIVPFRETIIKVDSNIAYTSSQATNTSNNTSHTNTSKDDLEESSDDENVTTSGAHSSHPHWEVDGEGYLTISTPNKKSIIKVKAVPLPEEIVKLLEENESLLRKINEIKKNRKVSNLWDTTPEIKRNWQEFKEKLRQCFDDCDSSFLNGVNGFEKIWSFGPKYSGPNILFNFIEDFSIRNFWSDDTSTTIDKRITDSRIDYEFSFINGFQMAAFAGPLCEEPLHGVGFVIKEWTLLDNSSLSESDPYGPFAGQIVSTVKDACRRAFQQQPQRLMAAMYSCTIQVTSNALGKMYTVIRRRHGRTIDGDMVHGSQTFTVTCILPVIESFQFSSEIRKQTSGSALPQLVFSHWEVIDIDPFWVPTTEEEYEMFGEKADTENRGRKYMNDVRRRKGLPVDEKLVEFAEKQRTFKRNK